MKLSNDNIKTQASREITCTIVDCLTVVSWKIVLSAMDGRSPLVVLGYVLGALLCLRCFLKRVNWWFYENPLGELQHLLPPGDLGWPIVGNMLAFLRSFKSTDPDSFIRNFHVKYGNAGIYKAFMFGSPSIIVTTPETCRGVLVNDGAFKPGWPYSTVELIGKKSFVAVSHDEHKRLRRITASPINGNGALLVYVPYIEECVKSALEKWVTMGEIEFLTQLRKLTFKIIMHIFIGSEHEHVMNDLEKEYTALNEGIRAMSINLPGFAYHKALKARKNLVDVLQSILDERRSNNFIFTKQKDMVDRLMDVEDEDGRRLSDEEIIDLLLMYLNAGHESSGHITMWATIFLQENPDVLQKAKEEQQWIIKKRPLAQKQLMLSELRDMKFLYKVINETLRLVTFSSVVFREAKMNTNISGYTIPYGWKVLIWFRSLHLDPLIYPNPKEFNPSRWDNFVVKAGSFLPFGAGSRICPGNDLAMIEIAIFLHYFLLNYELERLNPKCHVLYLPHTRPRDNCLAKIKRKMS